jgi:hypothetical protein
MYLYGLESPVLYRRILFCNCLSFMILVFALVGIKPHKKCNFINRINFLICKADSLQHENIFLKKIKIRFLISTSLCWLIFIVEFFVTLFIHTIMNPSDQPFLTRLPWISVTFSRLLCVSNEILALLICTVLEVRFSVLNKEIRSLKPNPPLYLSKSSKHTQKNKIEIAMAKFSNLSIALKILNQHFSLFWTIVLAQHCIILLIMLTVLVGDPNVFSKSMLTPLLAITVIRLLSICFICGNTSHEVCIGTQTHSC